VWARDILLQAEKGAFQFTLYGWTCVSSRLESMRPRKIIKAINPM
jgi:hypothetical protein